jgi:hypothetical protein
MLFKRFLRILNGKSDNLTDRLEIKQVINYIYKISFGFWPSIKLKFSNRQINLYPLRTS